MQVYQNHNEITLQSNWVYQKATDNKYGQDMEGGEPLDTIDENLNECHFIFIFIN